MFWGLLKKLVSEDMFEDTSEQGALPSESDGDDDIERVFILNSPPSPLALLE
jgi:hypothetical protein